MTKKQIENVEAKVGSMQAVDGYDALDPADQAKIDAAMAAAVTAAPPPRKKAATKAAGGDLVALIEAAVARAVGG